MQDTDEPISHIHFTAEGEVTFKSILFVPAAAPRGLFDEYGSKKNDFIKVPQQLFGYKATMDWHTSGSQCSIDVS